MVARRRTKRSRMRGSHTHGWGDKKKRRNAGHKGGHGRAGSGKKADQKKPSFWHLGRRPDIGFTSIYKKIGDVINVGDLNLFVENHKIEKKGSAYELNLKALGYRKLLSKGNVKYPLTITVDAATEDAVKKITAAHGTVQLPKAE